MAYTESPVVGYSIYADQFRVWTSTTRTFDGSPAQNNETWSISGGINRVASNGWTLEVSGVYALSSSLAGSSTSTASFDGNFTPDIGLKWGWGLPDVNVNRNTNGTGYSFNVNNQVYFDPVTIGSQTVLPEQIVTAPLTDSLNTKYRWAYISNVVGDITDNDNPWVEYSNPGQLSVNAWFEFPNLTGGTRYLQRNGIGSRNTWSLSESERNQLRAVLTNNNQSTIRIVIESSVNGVYSPDYRDRSYAVVNADPTFSDFSYADTNAATAAITGSNQVLVQGKSTLAATVSTANKAIANKAATMKTYNFSLGAYSLSSDWSNTSDVVKNIGTVSVTGTQNLSVRATDSRGNGKTITKSLTIIPYSSPVFSSTLTVKYTNNFDVSGGISASTLDGIIGTIAPMPLNGTNKNAVDATTGVQYDISKGNNTSYSGTWKNVPTTVATNGQISTNFTNLSTDIQAKMAALGHDNTVIWYIKFRITDKLETTTYTATVDMGKPIFRIGTDGFVYSNEQPLMSSHVGQIIFSLTLDTPTKVQQIYGGTWITFAPGRMLVGLNPNDPDFATANQDGGQKDVMAHSHKIPSYMAGSSAVLTINDHNNDALLSTDNAIEGESPTSSNEKTSRIAGSGANNMNPYKVVYMWLRTS